MAASIDLNVAKKNLQESLGDEMKQYVNFICFQCWCLTMTYFTDNHYNYMYKSEEIRGQSVVNFCGLLPPRSAHNGVGILNLLSFVILGYTS
jgi:hypothetical protein